MPIPPTIKATSFHLPPGSPVSDLAGELATLLADELPVKAMIAKHAAIEVALGEAIAKRAKRSEQCKTRKSE